MDLAGTTILVTGGARRVGRAIAEELAHAGAKIVIHHAHSDAEAAALRTSLPGSTVVKGDLRDPAAAQKLIDDARQATGDLDAIVSSAADYARTPLATLTDEQWDGMLALNVTAPMRLIRAGARVGVRSVVNIVDVAAWQPWAHWSAYAVSKAALLHLTRCLAIELAPHMRINAVAPGTVIFPDDWDDARRASQLARVPLGREGSPEDVARAVKFLLTEEYLTGVCLPVDGGSGLR
jgi:pteridine reductase